MKLLKVPALFFLLLLPLLLAVNPASTKDLEGKTFDIQITDKDMIKGSKPIDDHITFQGGALLSTYLRDDLHYRVEVKYTATKRGDAIAFEGKAHHRNKGDVTWSGIVQLTGRHLISGTMTWLRTGDKSLRMEFSGTEAVTTTSP
jgi:hypothetical protein